MLKLLANARVFAPEDLGLCHVLVGGGRILAIDDDLDALASDLGSVVAETMQPAHVSLWLRREAGR